MLFFVCPCGSVRRQKENKKTTEQKNTIRTAESPLLEVFETNKEPSLEKIGKALQGSDWYPEGVNVGIGRIVSDNEIDLRVFERGAGITLACGSGACAAALIAIEDNAIETPVKVNFEKGSIFIDYNTEGKQITARGKAEFIKEISVTIQ